MKHGSLFSGIGGFDLAAEWMGWENVFHCEWNPFGQKVLKHYWPKAISYEDITKTDFSIHRGNIDIITGGFPCQPYSSAGKRLGKEDERHLWPHMLRAIKEISPSYIVGENVRGLTNWNGGMVFEEVCTQMEDFGYKVAPFLIPASGVGAPHQRERIWFVAHSISSIERRNKFRSLRCQDAKIGREGSQTIHNAIRSDGIEGDVADTLCNRIGESREGGQSEFTDKNGSKGGIITHSKNIGQEYALENGELEWGRFRQSNKRNAWDTFPSVSPICVGNDGFSDRLDGITFPKWRNESIKAGGNAVVPQVVYQIFKAIEAYEKLNNVNNPVH